MQELELSELRPLEEFDFGDISPVAPPRTQLSVPAAMMGGLPSLPGPASPPSPAGLAPSARPAPMARPAAPRVQVGDVQILTEDPSRNQPHIMNVNPHGVPAARSVLLNPAEVPGVMEHPPSDPSWLDKALIDLPNLTTEQMMGAQEPAAAAVQLDQVPPEVKSTTLEQAASEDKDNPVLGATVGALRTAAGLTSPKNIGILAGMTMVPATLPGVAARLVSMGASAYFAVDMARAAAESQPAIKAAWESGDETKAAELTTEAFASGLMSLASLGHAVKGGKAFSATSDIGRALIDSGVPANPNTGTVEASLGQLAGVKIDQHNVRAALELQAEWDRGMKAMEANRKATKMLEKSTRESRRAESMPPEEGIPEDQARAQAAEQDAVEAERQAELQRAQQGMELRNQVALDTTGRSWELLDTSERLTVDDLIAEQRKQAAASTDLTSPAHLPGESSGQLSPREPAAPRQAPPAREVDFSDIAPSDIAARPVPGQPRPVESYVTVDEINQRLADIASAPKLQMRPEELASIQREIEALAAQRRVLELSQGRSASGWPAPIEPPAERPSTAAEAARVFMEPVDAGPVPKGPRTAEESAQVFAAYPEDAGPVEKGQRSAAESARTLMPEAFNPPDAGPVPKGPYSAEESAKAFIPAGERGEVIQARPEASPRPALGLDDVPKFEISEDSPYAGEDAAALYRAAREEQSGRYQAIQAVDQKLAGNMPPARRAKLVKERARLRQEYEYMYQEVGALAPNLGETMRGQVEGPAEPPASSVPQPASAAPAPEKAKITRQNAPQVFRDSLAELRRIGEKVYVGAPPEEMHAPLLDMLKAANAIGVKGLPMGVEHATVTTVLDLADRYERAVRKVMGKKAPPMARGKSSAGLDANEMQRYSVTSEAILADGHIDRGAVERSFPGVPVTDHGAHYQVNLPDGRTIFVKPNATIRIDPDKFRTSYGRELEGTDFAKGGFAPVDRDGIIKLTKEGDAGTLRHETFHSAMAMALEPREIKAVLEKYGTEEAAAQAYEKWQPAEEPNTLFGKIAAFFQRIYRHFRPDAESVMRDVDSGRIWEKARNRRAISAEEVVRYSVDTLPDWRKAYREYIAKYPDSGITAQDFLDLSRDMDQMASILAAHPEYLPEDMEGTPLQGNQEYVDSLENDTICPRRAQFGPTVEAIQRQLNRPLSPQELTSVALLMRRAGHTYPCLFCYVESNRTKINEQLIKKSEERGVDPRAVVDEEYRAQYLRDNPDKASEFDSNNKKGLMYQAYHQSVKLLYGYTPYSFQILRQSAEKLAAKAARGGQRIFSSSDFKPEHMLDIAQAVADLWARKAPAHAYTKQVPFVEVFGDTGMKINMSITARGGINGEPIVEDATQGIPWEFAKQARERYPNAGTMLMATNDAQIEWGMRQPWIDQIIPYHHSSLKPEVRENLQYKDYTGEQHEFDRWGSGTINATKDLKSTDHGNDPETYLRLLEERGLEPRFTRFIYKVDEYGRALRDVDGKPIRRPDVTPEMHFKMVHDVARTDSLQSPVDARRINWDRANEIIRQWQEQGGTNEAPLDDIVASFVRLEKTGDLPKGIEPSDWVPPTQLHQIKPAAPSEPMAPLNTGQGKILRQADQWAIPAARRYGKPLPEVDMSEYSVGSAPGPDKNANTYVRQPGRWVDKARESGDPVDEHINWDRIDLPDMQRAHMREMIREAIDDQGLDPKEIESHEEVKRQVASLDPNLAKYFDPEALAITGRAARIAARQTMNRLNGESMDLWEKSKDDTLTDGEKQDLKDQAAAKDREFWALAGAWSGIRSADGRNLAVHNIVVDNGWDVAFQLQRAKRLAGEDLPEEKQRAIREQVNRGIKAKAEKEKIEERFGGEDLKSAAAAVADAEQELARDREVARQIAGELEETRRATGEAVEATQAARASRRQAQKDLSGARRAEERAAGKFIQIDDELPGAQAQAAEAKSSAEQADALLDESRKKLRAAKESYQRLLDRRERVLAKNERYRAVSEELLQAKHQIAAEMAELQKAGAWKTASYILRAGMLTGLGGASRDVLGTFSNVMALEQIKQIPASIMDMVLGSMQAKSSGNPYQRTTVAPTLHDWVQGVASVRQGLKNFNTKYKYGTTSEKLTEHPYELVSKYGSMRIPMKAATAVYKFRGGLDEVSKAPAYELALREIARTEATNLVIRGKLDKSAVNDYVERTVKNPSTQQRANATSMAEFAVFQNETGLYRWWSKKNAHLGDWANFIADAVVAPFMRATTSVGYRVAEYSGLGMARAPRAMARAIRGNLTPEYQRAAAQSFGRGMVGATLIGTGYLLAKAGVLTGPQKDQPGQRGLDEQAGMQPGSIKAWDKWIQISGTSPIGNLLTAGAGLFWAAKRDIRGEEVGENSPWYEWLTGKRAGAMAAAAFQSVLDQPYFQGIEELTEFAKNPQRQIGRFAASRLSSVVPTIVSNVAAATDSKPRDLRDSGIAGQLKSKVPFARQTLPERKTALSDDSPHPRWSRFGPMNATQSREGPLTQELVRLRVPLNKPVRGEDGNEDPLVFQIRSEVRGRLEKFALGEVMRDDRYAGLKDDVKREALKEGIKDVQRMLSTRLKSSAQKIGKERFAEVPNETKVEMLWTALEQITKAKR